MEGNSESQVTTGDRMGWWDRPLAWVDSLLIAAFVIVLGAGAWLIFVRTTIAERPTAAVMALEPALVLKQEAGQLWVAGDRLAALAKWEEAHQLRPESRDITESLAQAQVAISADFLRAGDPASALPHLEAAYALLPDEPEVLHEYQALRAYLTGRDAVAAGNWELAYEALGPLYNLDPHYLDVHNLIETTLAGQQQAEQAQRAQNQQALSQARLAGPGARLRAALAPPPEISNQPGQTTLPSLGAFAGQSNKHIVVSINAQRMYVYENGQLIWDWVASTGEPGRPTIPGQYRIQSKLENARSNVWSLWMPYWQGIYWAGSVENGIHGQVEFDSGGRLWEGYLGTQITFGCVMISDENASTLFNWTEMGTPVSIHWDWNPAQVPDANGNPI